MNTHTIDQIVLDSSSIIRNAVTEPQNIQPSSPSETIRRNLLQPDALPTVSKTDLSLKKALDAGLASILLLIVSPLMALIAFLIKLDSEGPVFHRQTRVGLNRRRSNRTNEPPAGFIEKRKESHYGQPFTVLKFRSMVDNAESNGRAIWCSARDSRITRIGFLLRKTHLDELPQLINVLLGEMSLVGPRPERPEIVAQLVFEVPGYQTRLAMKPGLTGLAQIRQKPDLAVADVKKKIKYDLLYFKKFSFFTDLKILAGTIPLAFGLPPGWTRKLKAAWSSAIDKILRLEPAAREAMP